MDSKPILLSNNVQNRMENRFKTELGCEVASNTFNGWLLGAFWARNRVLNFGTFSQIENPEVAQICFHRQSCLRRRFWIGFGSNFAAFGTPISR